MYAIRDVVHDDSKYTAKIARKITKLVKYMEQIVVLAVCVAANVDVRALRYLLGAGKPCAATRPLHMRYDRESIG